MCESCSVLVCCLFTLCFACNVCDPVGCECICCNRASVGVVGCLGCVSWCLCVGGWGCGRVWVISNSDSNAAMSVCVFVA